MNSNAKKLIPRGGAPGMMFRACLASCAAAAGAQGPIAAPIKKKTYL